MLATRFLTSPSMLIRALISPSTKGSTAWVSTVVTVADVAFKVLAMIVSASTTVGATLTVASESAVAPGTLTVETELTPLLITDSCWLTVKTTPATVVARVETISRLTMVFTTGSASTVPTTYNDQFKIPTRQHGERTGERIGLATGATSLKTPLATPFTTGAASLTTPLTSGATMAFLVSCAGAAKT